MNLPVLGGGKRPDIRWHPQKSTQMLKAALRFRQKQTFVFDTRISGAVIQRLNSSFPTGGRHCSDGHPDARSTGQIAEHYGHESSNHQFRFARYEASNWCAHGQIHQVALCHIFTDQIGDVEPSLGFSAQPIAISVHVQRMLYWSFMWP